MFLKGAEFKSGKMKTYRRWRVVMVTHNAEIAKMANRVVRVRDGRISSIRINSWPMKAMDIVW